MFYTRINKIKVFNNREGFPDCSIVAPNCAYTVMYRYRQTTLNRAEHHPHSARDRRDTADTTGKIPVDYTLFGFENEAENKGLLITTGKV